MRIASLVWVLVAILVGAFAVDFAQRVTSPDIVAVSFAEGGDDAYYFFTVARNIAQGHGITIDGAHWTTGFQPLWALVCAIAFLAFLRVFLCKETVIHAYFRFFSVFGRHPMDGGFHLAPVGRISAACGGIVCAMDFDHFAFVVF